MRIWLNMHLMLTRGPVAGAWATLRMRRQNLPKPGWVKHRTMCELAVSSLPFSFSTTPSHHRQGVECDPLESQPLNIRAHAQPRACGCKLSKIATLACAVTMTVSDHKTREKLLPVARDAESRTVHLAARTRCVKMTSSIGSTLQPWTVVFRLVGHHQQAAECDPLESHEHKGLCWARCVWVQAEQDHYTGLFSNYDSNRDKTREKLLPCARNSESRSVNLAARTRCVKMTSSTVSTLQPWTAVSA